MQLKFYRCSVCGNLIVKIIDGGPTPLCCGRSMVELDPNTRDASIEKHVPFIDNIDSHSVKVRIGNKEHPMEDEHHIEFICIETEKGFQLARLHPDNGPHACFTFRGKPKTIYEYCNLHGLWKLDVPNP